MQTILIKDDEWREGFGKKLFSLQQTGQFCDVIIKTVEDARLLVHSCVLAAASPLLKGVIESALSDSSLGTIMLSSDIDVNTWTHMLEFMYMGNSEVDANLVPSLLSGASILKIDTLVDRCNEVISVKPVEEEAATELYSAIAQIKEDTDQVIDAPNQAIVVPDQTMAIPDQTMSVSEENVDQQEQNIDAHNPEIDTNDREMDAQDYIDDVQDEAVTLDSNANSTVITALHPGPEDFRTDLSELLVNSGKADSAMVAVNKNIENEPTKTVFWLTEATLPDENVGITDNIILDRNLTMLNPSKIPQGECTDSNYKVVGYTEQGRKKYQCLVCDVICTNPTLHKVVHSEEFPYECKETGCGKNYKRKSALKYHILQTHSSGTETHRCLKCGKMFSTAYLLKKHINISCTDARPFVCRICEKRFKTMMTLKYHSGVHAEEKLFVCEVCNKAMPTKAHLKNHMIVHQEGNFSCECGKYFKSDKRLKEHYRTVHDPNNPNRCFECERNFKSTEALEKHKLKHGTLYQCCACRKGFKLEITCHIHEKNKHNIPHPELAEVSDDITCPVCKKIFKTKMSMTNHLVVHTVQHSSRLFSCDICNKAFKQKKHLQGHMQDVHVEKTVPCEKCGKKFKNAKQLKNHMACHLKPFECEKCGARFSSLRALNTHDKHHQNGEVVFNMRKCPHCDKCFPNKSGVKFHIQESHPGEPLVIQSIKFKSTSRKSYACTYCDMKFLNSKTLALHLADIHPNKAKVTVISNDSMNEESSLRLNRQDIPGTFNCELCSAIFKQESNLTNHEIKKHSKATERLHCSECPVKFITSRTLKQHQYQVHKIGQISSCDLCKRDFYLKDDLEKHILAIHNPGEQALLPLSVSHDPQDENVSTLLSKRTVSKTSVSSANQNVLQKAIPPKFKSLLTSFTSK